jgi:hypothetical protein
MKSVVLVSLAVDPKTGQRDARGPFMVRALEPRNPLSKHPARNGLYEDEPSVIEQFLPGESEARFEAEWSDQDGEWKFGKRVTDA